MNFQMIIMAVSFVVTVILAMVVIPILKRIKIGQIERDDGPESHLKKQGTPTMGGIIFMISIIICVTICYINLSMNGKIESAQNLLPILILTIGFGIVGFIDDFKKLVLHNTKGLTPKRKMIGLLLISIAYTLFIIKFASIGTETIIPFAKISINLPIYIYIPFAILVILGTTNAVNLTDGIDGLSSSVCAIITTCLTVIAMANNNIESGKVKRGFQEPFSVEKKYVRNRNKEDVEYADTGYSQGIYRCRAQASTEGYYRPFGN